jgi:hypothetical protein
VGYIEQIAREFIAKDLDGRTLGAFPSLPAAADAVSTAHQRGRPMTASTDIPISAELEARVRRATKRRLDGNGPVYLKYNSRRVAYDVSDLETWAAGTRRRHTAENRNARQGG